MTDSFMHNHQAALDSQMEDNAIKDLEDAGIYPVPDNDAVLENLYEKWEVLIPKEKDALYTVSYENEIVPFTAFFTEEAANNYIKEMVQRDFEELPEPGDYDD